MHPSSVERIFLRRGLEVSPTSSNAGADGCPVLTEPSDYLASANDTVFIPPNTEVKLFVTFPDSASDGWPFMFHCLFLRHEGRGMMGHYLVVEANQNLDPEDPKIASEMSH